MKDFRLPFKELHNVCYTIKSLYRGNITAWFGNSTKQDRQALQRVVRLAKHIIPTELPDLQTIYHMQGKTKVRKIPFNGVFLMLISGKCIHSLKAGTERMKRSIHSCRL